MFNNCVSTTMRPADILCASLLPGPSAFYCVSNLSTYITINDKGARLLSVDYVPQIIRISG